jgi:hypothetical protein
MTITVTGGPAYGLSWNKTTQTDGNGTRVASAAGLTAGADFNALSGGAWGLRRCNLWDDGTPTAYYGDRCYTDTDIANMGQAMVQIPKFYYYMEYDAGTTTYYWFVTTNASTTIDVGLGIGPQAVKIHPAFTRNTVTKNDIYLGAYEGFVNAPSGKLESKSDVAPTASINIAQFRIAAQLRAGVADKWEINDYLTTSAVQLLILIEYGGFNSAALLGQGLTNTTIQNTGLTASYGNTSYGVTSDGTHAISYRGIENFYGNVHKHIDGLNIKADHNPWIADHGFVSDTFAAPYVDTTLTLYASSDYAGDIATTATIDYGFLPSAGGGSASTKLCSYYMQITGNAHALFGGRKDWPIGMFSILPMLVAVSATADYGARLMYIG